MCGIAGIISLNNVPSKLIPNINKMAEAMKNRGLDDEGYFVKDVNNSSVFFGKDTEKESINYLNKRNILNIYQQFDNNVLLAFAHRRLKIVDLSPLAFQPMSCKNGKYHIIYNGEVYNYKEIRLDLQKKGYNFISNSDTEVILNSYIEWGKDFLHRLNGMFAFVILDEIENKVFIARDRVGIKPLFYTIQNNKFILASDIKTIIASGLYTPEVNFEGLYNNLTISVSPCAITSFKDIYWVEESQFIEINLSSGKIIKEKYWDIPTGVQNFNMKLDEAVDLLEEKLIKSIKFCLNADVQVGNFMSGGVDSTLITAISQKIVPDIKAFTLGFDGELDDEVSQAVENAKAIGANHLIKNTTKQEIFNSINDIVLCYEEPYPNLSPTYFLSKYVYENDVKVVLNGLGADELFYGYAHYTKYQTILNAKKFKPLINFCPNIHQKVKRLKQHVSYNNVGDFFAFTRANFKDYDLEKLIGKNKFNPITSFSTSYNLSNKSFDDFQEVLSYYDMKWFIGKHQTYRADQFLMRFSLEGRFPFLDHELIEAAATIPTTLKIKDNIMKFVLKKLAEKYMPYNTIHRPKKGFNTPITQLLDSVLKNISIEKLNNLKKREIFVPNEIDRLINNFSDNKQKIWQLAMTEMWFENFFK